MCHGLRLQCRHRYQLPYTCVMVSDYNVVRDILLLPQIEVAHSLSILNKYSVSDSTFGVKECKHMQLMI